MKNWIIELTKNKLGVKPMIKFVTLRPKPYSYLKDYNDENKKTKSSKMYVTEQKTKFQNYKKSVETDQTEK